MNATDRVNNAAGLISIIDSVYALIDDYNKNQYQKVFNDVVQIVAP